ncbi:MAG: hypothetical protein KIY11_09625 [Thermoplasmata archaeon]|nr:hypothetical protein [Candidatus Sysuiplasma acidicola]
MENKALMAYYLSMIVFIVGSIFVIMFAVVIEPVVVMYHEQTHSMTSPIFGNFYTFLVGLEAISIIFTAVSLALYLVSFILARRANLKMSRITMFFPLILYAFAFGLIGVSLV